MNQSLSIDLVASLATLLNEAGVENVLWGNSLLSIYGVPTIVMVRFLRSENGNISLIENI
jgi:hypothetical protein